MRLESAVGLKKQLLTDVVEPFAAAASGRPVEPIHADRLRSITGVPPTAFSVSARTLSSVPRMQRSVALGIARRNSEYQLAIRVQRQSLLTSRLVSHLVQQALGEVDVRMIGRIDKRQDQLAGPATAVSLAARPWHQQKTRPLLIGASVGHVDVTAGTIGGFVTAGDRRCVLSNNHVLANEDRGSAGDAIVQPGIADGGSPVASRIASLSTAIPLNLTDANVVDAALAVLDDDIDADLNRLRDLTPAGDRQLAGLGPALLDKAGVVRKVGRTTGGTEGRITAFDIDNIIVSYEAGNIRFDNQVEIEGTGAEAFGDGGDSGSLIVDEGMLAVALLFAGGDSGGSNDRGLTYANPIHAVLEGLHASLLF